MTSLVLVCLTALLFQDALMACIYMNLNLCYIRYIWHTVTVVFDQKETIDLLLYHNELLFMNANYVTFF